MNHRRNRTQRDGAAMVASLSVLLLLTACASDQPKPLPQPTPDQIRGHADRAFEKLKQDEQERPAQSPPPRY